MQHFYDRLIEERKRLALTQDQMALQAKVSKRTYCNYEAGDSAPTAIQLALLALVGVDVQYVINGIKLYSGDYPTGGLNSNHEVRQELLSEREYALLDDFRALGDKEKDAAETMLHAATKSKMKRKA